MRPSAIDRLLGELAMIGHSVARAYVAIGLPDWFNRHLISMDSALAARLKATQT